MYLVQVFQEGVLISTELCHSCDLRALELNYGKQGCVCQHERVQEDRP